MIRRLRRKIIGITSVLLSVVLVVILILIYQFTAAGLYEDSLAALQSAQSDLFGPRHPGDLQLTTHSPCFLLEQRPDGTLIALGSSLYDLSDRQALESILESARTSGRHIGELEDANLRYLALEDGPAVRYAFVDISAERDTLNRLNVTCLIIFLLCGVLFHAISVLLARWAIRPVEQAFEQQRQFVADASHELKTPLTVILTNAELLDDPQYDDQSRKRFCANILTMSRQMRGLVEELLDQARVDNGAAVRQPLNMSELTQEVALIFEPVYFEAGRVLETHIQPDLNVNGNAEQLRRVVEILLDNGCKYSSNLSPVAIRLSKHGKNCLLSVTSPGTPLTEQQCQDIFKRFYRVDTARTMNRSYGLGLPIAQRIVQQHQGTIWAQSHDRWNTFFASIPLC